MSRPSKEEQGLLIEFRKRVGDVLKTKEHRSDAFLLRWLRARDLNLDNAESLILGSFKWREENDVDTVLSRDFDPWMKTNYPFWTKGRDLEGRPVVYLPIGSWDMRKAIAKGQEDELLDFISFLFESILETIRNINKTLKKDEYPFSQIFLLVDWENYSYSQLIHWKALQKLLKMASTYEAHYPEILFRVLFINCPSIFPLFMAMLKPIITPNTLNKITCHSKREEWAPLIESFVSKDQFPACIGGTYPSDDSDCPTIHMT